MGESEIGCQILDAGYRMLDAGYPADGFNISISQYLNISIS